MSDPYSKEQQTGRVWVCRANNDGCTRTQPCRSCLGRRNRRSGMSKQRAAKKLLAVPPSKFHGTDGNEENWRGSVRVEVKSGAMVSPVWTRFAAAEAQSEKNRAVGDTRPFIAVFMPPNTTEGLFVGRLSQVREIAAGLLENEVSE